ncbi:MAG: multidrug efflux SMR transporter [Armatimonadetes bacterium]|nr:multidrug efflux SMR transporter [Armatimonadota bacterium]
MFGIAQHWLYLGLAIGLGVCGTLCMKESHGFRQHRWSAAMVIFYLLGFSCLAMTVKVIPIGTTYAIWSGMGTAMIALVGIFHYHEPAPPLKILSIALIIIGVVGLNLVGSSH